MRNRIGVQNNKHFFIKTRLDEDHFVIRGEILRSLSDDIWTPPRRAFLFREVGMCCFREDFESQKQDVKVDDINWQVVLAWAGIWFFCFAFWVFVFGAVVSSARADVPDDLAIRAIIGEAANQGENGMLAVACALRNRGTLKGVYGVNAKHIDRQPSWVWERARRAWEKSSQVDITKGADHWHNVNREGETYWTVKMTKTVCIKDHCFYK